MRTTRTFALVGIAGFVAALSAAIYVSDGPAHRWLAFYAWKLTAGKAHRGDHFNTGDVSIYYETYGAGPPVLVLHGGLGSHEGMSYQIRALSESHFVVAPDSRGHGRSTDSDAPLSYSVMSDDMSKLLDHLRIDRVDVVGWSDGGIIGLDLAMRHPEHIRRLVAISANYDVDGIPDGPDSDPDVPRAPLRYKLLAPDPAHWPVIYRKAVTMWHTQPHYTLAELSQIRCPTLIVAGQHDLILPEHTAKLAAAIAGARKIIVPGASHFGPLEQPETYNAIVLRFLDAP